MENTKNRNSGSNNEPEYGSRHSRNRSADASGNSAHGARGAAEHVHARFRTVLNPTAGYPRSGTRTRHQPRGKAAEAKQA